MVNVDVEVDKMRQELVKDLLLCPVSTSQSVFRCLVNLPTKIYLYEYLSNYCEQ